MTYKFFFVLFCYLFFCQETFAINSNDSVLIKKIASSFELHETFLGDKKSIFILLQYNRIDLSDTLIIKNEIDLDKVVALSESLKKCRINIRNNYNGKSLVIPLVYINASNNLITSSFENVLSFFQNTNKYTNVKILNTIIVLGMGLKIN
ncbi:MAG: hypothetical protein Q8K64_00740 [Sediminibacterium sp.]|nr:hypothetical protein [Sediminibacterium sp.]